MLHKIRDDTKCSYETALTWAFNAKMDLLTKTDSVQPKILAIWFIINVIHHMGGKVLQKSWDKMVQYNFSVTVQNTSKLTFVVFN